MSHALKRFAKLHWLANAMRTQTLPRAAHRLGALEGPRPVRPLAALRSRCNVRACSTHAHNSSNATFTITTPLYYVNAAPHMGSAYPTIAADVLSRYQRMAGKRVRFLTGTDEHGEKIALAAAARNMSPQEHCDSIVADYKSLWQQLDIAYDGFIRTTDPHHEQLVAEVLQRVWDKGDIYKAAYSGWYCVDCEEYKDEKEMDGERNCPTHRKPCQHREEENYFFALTKYQSQLEQLLGGDSEFVQPPSRKNEVLGWVKEGVRDFSISRSAVSWGIPLPQDPTHTVYVWFDALNGYLSGLLPLTDSPAANGSSSSSSSGVDGVQSVGWPADVHLIGKDILRFHAIYWPAMLMSAGLPLPKQVFGHGFLTKDGLKMGKSLGNTLDPAALVTTYGADAVRLFFMKDMVFGQDGNFSEASFRDSVNAALANNIGNMLNRTLGLLRKYHSSTLPVSAAEAAGADHPLRLVLDKQLGEAAAAYDRLSPHQAVEAVLEVGKAVNAYLEETAPWTALKKGDEQQKAAAAQVLVSVLESCRIVALALLPVTPGLAARMHQQLGLPPLTPETAQWSATSWGVLQAGHRTSDPAPVFARIDDTIPYVTELAPAAAAAAPAGKK